MSNKLYFKSAGVFVLLAALGIAGQSDYEAEVQSEETYCKMVESGKWPDYNNNYLSLCAQDVTREVTP